MEQRLPRRQGADSMKSWLVIFLDKNKHALFAERVDAEAQELALLAAAKILETEVERGFVKGVCDGVTIIPMAAGAGS